MYRDEKDNICQRHFTDDKKLKRACNEKDQRRSMKDEILAGTMKYKKLYESVLHLRSSLKVIEP